MIKLYGIGAFTGSIAAGVAVYLGAIPIAYGCGVATVIALAFAYLS